MTDFDVVVVTKDFAFRYPTLNRAIRAYNVILDELEDFQEKPTTPRILKHAAKQAMEKMQIYYRRTDDTNLYAIATAMDPRLKYQYWKDEEWEEEFQEEARKAVEDEWLKDYKTETTTQHSIHDDDDAQGRFKLKKRRTIDELERYINEACVEDDNDGEVALKYWARSSAAFPKLAKMARKYLAIPVTSTPCERLFSKAKHFIPATRNRLSHEALKQSMLLESWVKLGIWGKD